MSLGPFLQSLDQSGVKFLSIFAVADRFQVLDFCFAPTVSGGFGILRPWRVIFYSPTWRTGFGSPPFRTGFDSSSEEWEVVLVRRFGRFVDLPFRRCGLFPEGGLYMTLRCFVVARRYSGTIDHLLLRRCGGVRTFVSTDARRR